MPELSIVMATSTDNYGSVAYREVEPAVPTNEKDRTELCIFTLEHAFQNIDYELIMVEWNPKPNTYRLSDWDFLRKRNIRIITVPSEFANEICPERGFHETHAKNIGIRRSLAPMILSINNDCLWLDEFPRQCLFCNGVMVANRPTVYHTVLDVEKNIEKLREYCSKPENIVHESDWNSNGDFTLMSRDLWYKLQGLSTPRGDVLAGLDMWQVARAERLVEKWRYTYPFNITHIRHPGMELSSSHGHTITSLDWGFPNKTFIEGEYYKSK